MTVTAPFEPRWASAPGSTILEGLSAKGLSPEDLADALSLSDPDTRRLLSGELEIGESIAASLSRIVGGSADFWIARDKQFRQSTRYLSADEITSRLPMKQLVDWGWIQESSTWRAGIDSALDFFGVESCDEWNNLYRQRLDEANYRASPSISSTDVAVSAWLRRAELDALSSPTPPWNPTAISPTVASIREASRLADPEKFLPLISESLAEMGLFLAVVKAPKGCALSGAAFTSGDQRIIALSARHLTDDHLFFTLMHELGHHVLHGEAVFLDEFEDADSSNVEMEADEFATSALIPGGFNSLVGRPNGPTMRQVVAFAGRVGIAPGILVGQLQHASVLRFNQLNRLKRRYTWQGLTLKSART